jgi:hypothetical protein
MLLFCGNGWRVNQLVEQVFQAPVPLADQILVTTMIVGAVFHLCVCLSFVAIMHTALQFGGERGPRSARTALISSVLDAHIPLALWSLLSAVILSGVIVSIDSPQAFFQAVDVVYWSRATAYGAALLWFTSAFAVEFDVPAWRALKYSSTAATLLGTAMAGVNLLLSATHLSSVR